VKWLIVKERESQQWYVLGPTKWETELYYPPGKSRMKKRAVQRSWVYPKPEHVSPFIEAHKVIDAHTEEEARCMISSWT
jgi:hypothetical protein